ncbi:MAG: hypothetical protein CMJ18_14740 [Phycisphaeraceae bacterium]|nr:hypothetical protein [Phycisphaeraceae bacterium]
MAAPFRVVVLANKLKKEVTDALTDLRPWLEQRARIVAEPDITSLDPEGASEFPEADLALVLGGDGTLLAQARNLADLDLPVLGVNFGKVGFLAEFQMDDLQRHWDQIAGGRCRCSDRLLLEVMIFDADAADCRADRLDEAHLKGRSLAMNDAVVTAGTPFRMIELDLSIDPVGSQTRATRFAGDGVIIATASGSTAYNLNAGGAIVSPGVDALCITPICPQSLSFRPVIINASSGVAVRVSRANEGTMLVVDGQVSFRLESDDQVYVCRYERSIRLIHNPRLNYWKTLAKKMHWAARPRRG